MKQEQLPARWQEWLEQNPTAADIRRFHTEVQVAFEDGSSAFFKHAYAVHDRWNQEVLVMSEHCGYHVFGTLVCTVTVLQRAGLFDAVSRSRGLPPLPEGA